jgi:hypothetical protein
MLLSRLYYLIALRRRLLDAFSSLVCSRSFDQSRHTLTSNPSLRGLHLATTSTQEKEITGNRHAWVSCCSKKGAPFNFHSFGVLQRRFMRTVWHLIGVFPVPRDKNHVAVVRQSE